MQNKIISMSRLGRILILETHSHRVPLWISGLSKKVYILGNLVGVIHHCIKRLNKINFLCPNLCQSLHNQVNLHKAYHMANPSHWLNIIVKWNSFQFKNQHLK